MDVVECEVCRQLIPFDAYAEHITDCQLFDFLRTSWERAFTPNDLDEAFRELLGVTTGGNEYEMWSQLEEIIGKVEVGIEDLAAVTKPAPADPSADEVCPVCLDEFQNTLGKTTETLCGHLYCEPCITKWLKTSVRCPVCSTDLKDLMKTNSCNNHRNQMSSTDSSSKSTSATSLEPLSISDVP